MEKIQQQKLIDAEVKVVSASENNDVEAKTTAIIKTLEEHNIKTDDFGKGESKTLKEFGAEVLGGASRLMLDAASYKNIVRVVDVVLLRIFTDIDTGSSGRRILIQTCERYPDGRSRSSNQLPGSKKEPHENG